MAVFAACPTRAHAFPPPPADAPQGSFSQPVQGLASRRASTSASAYELSFADADIASVANEVLGIELKIPFMVDPAVTQKMSLRIDRRLGREQLLSAFESALALDDVVMVRGEGRIAILPRGKARAITPVRRLASARASLPPGYQVLAIPLAFATPSAVKKAIDGASGAATISADADDQQGYLVIAGTSAELRGALETIRLSDRNLMSSANVRTFQLRAASPSAIAVDLQRLLDASGATGVSVTPIDRLGQVVITARSAAVLDEASRWVDRLDAPSHEEAFSLWVYHPRNISAVSLADTLNQLLAGREGGMGRGAGAGATGAPPALNVPGVGGPRAASAGQAGSVREAVSGDDPDLRISVDKDTNTLVVMAPLSRWAPLRAVLDEMDRPPAQILIEAAVLEVTLGHEFSTGVDWSVLGAGGRLSVTSSQNANGSVTPSFPGFAASYLDKTVQATIQALASKTDVRVVSAPKLIALDNQQATLQVGDEVPIVNQTAQSTVTSGAPIVASTEYRDTGIILKIKPRVNGTDSVLLDFSQEVSSVSQTTTSTINSPTIQQRKFESEMTLRDGQTVAIGGLISSNRNLTDEGIPWFKDIPGLGVLFKGQDRKNTRTELIVLLSAHIIRTSDDADHALGELKAHLPSADDHDLLTTP